MSASSRTKRWNPSRGPATPSRWAPSPPAQSSSDVGCGAGFDTLLAARQVGPTGQVIAVDMTPAMRDKTRTSAKRLGLDHVDVRKGLAEELPVETGTADVVISNGVINLCPDKTRVLGEIARVLKPGGRVQIADIVVHLPVPQDAKDDIELWSG